MSDQNTGTSAEDGNNKEYEGKSGRDSKAPCPGLSCDARTTCLCDGGVVALAVDLEKRLCSDHCLMEIWMVICSERER